METKTLISSVAHLLLGAGGGEFESRCVQKLDLIESTGASAGFVLSSPARR